MLKPLFLDAFGLRINEELLIPDRHDPIEVQVPSYDPAMERSVEGATHFIFINTELSGCDPIYHTLARYILKNNLNVASHPEKHVILDWRHPLGSRLGKYRHHRFH